MDAFKNDVLECYKKEVKERWGNTDAWREYTERAKTYGKEEQSRAITEMDDLFAAFAACMLKGNAPNSEKAQVLVKTLQQHITTYYYHCTDVILEGLGQMYMADERFQKNIDKHQKGTAQFVSDAIAIYCKK